MIASIANTMIGSAIIVYPILFVKDGMLGSLMIMLLVGCIQYFTCRILVMHNRRDEKDFGISIRRVCGNTAFKANLIVNILILFFVSTAYFC